MDLNAHSLTWITCDVVGEPLRLFDLNLQTVRAFGVYLVHIGGTLSESPSVLAIGRGRIADRLANARQDPRLVREERRRGPVLVAFAEVGYEIIYGVERYLRDYYRPLAMDAVRNVEPVPVNLPFAA
jgi:hypothetical protein